MEPRYYGAAAQYNKPGGFNLNPKLLLVGGVALVIIIVLFVATAIITSLNAGPRNTLAAFIAQESDLQTLAQKSRDRIKSAELRKINAEFDVLLLSNSMVATEYLTEVYNTTEIPEEIVSANTDTESEADLKTAEQNSNFDATYANLLQMKVAALTAQAQKVKSQTGNQGLKTYMDATIAMLSGLDGQLDALQL